MFDFKPEEFVVEEILEDGAVLEAGKPFSREDAPGKFCHFVLQKRGWNTAQALDAVADCLHISRKRLDCAGTKDRNALTVQLCSAFAVPPQRLLSLKVKDIAINGAWNAGDKVRMGSLLGNRFTIMLNFENCKEWPDTAKVEARAKESGYCFPNYFGDQRFGSLRRNTHEVGKLLLQGKMEAAAMNFLTFTDEREEGAGREARKRLAEQKDFSKALSYFPNYLKYERTMIAHLSVYPKDFVGALRKLPRATLLMFVHAFQSHLFNEMLRKRIADGPLEAGKGDFWCDADEHGFPLLWGGDAVKQVKSKAEAAKLQKRVDKSKAFLAANIIGSESKLNAEEKAFLKEQGMSQENFVVKSIPEVSSRGSFRSMLAPLKGFEVLEQSPVKIRFALQSGAYATEALKHLLERS
ncbi:MAG: tRNA pseudouridine(13) synthase TruD [Candidatus Micrarchaeota archaeon]